MIVYRFPLFGLCPGQDIYKNILTGFYNLSPEKDHLAPGSIYE
jgi:hypothetical protein